jgi:small GTP-binding protein
MSHAPVRLILLGDSGVGKTQMMMRYCENSFSLSAPTTIGVDFKTKMVPIDGRLHDVQIWDTAGQELYRTIVKGYYRRAHGILVVYDVSASSSFQSLTEWISSIEKCALPGTPFVICGNKYDLEAKVDFETADEFARSKKASLFLTSAATGQGIEEAFEAIIGKANDRVGDIGVIPEPLKESKEEKKGECCTI